MLHFTIFNGGPVTHIDLVGLKPANGRYEIRGRSVLLDNAFFGRIAELIPGYDESRSIAHVVEVSTNAVREFPDAEAVGYARWLVGGIDLVRASFRSAAHSVQVCGGNLNGVIQHAFHWILQRFDAMDALLDALGHDRDKAGSWTWCEDFLSELLAMRQFGIGPP